MSPTDMLDSSVMFWLDLTPLLSPGTLETPSQRVFIKQLHNDEIPKMDLTGTHATVQLRLSQPLLEDIKEIYPSLGDLVMKRYIFMLVTAKTPRRNRTS